MRNYSSVQLYSETLEFNAYQIEIESNRIESKRNQSNRNQSNRIESNSEYALNSRVLLFANNDDLGSLVFVSSAFCIIDAKNMQIRKFAFQYIIFNRDVEIERWSIDCAWSWLILFQEELSVSIINEHIYIYTSIFFSVNYFIWLLFLLSYLFRES